MALADLRIVLFSAASGNRLYTSFPGLAEEEVDELFFLGKLISISDGFCLTNLIPDITRQWDSFYERRIIRLDGLSI